MGTQSVCRWERIEPDSDCWSSGCAEAGSKPPTAHEFEFNDGGPRDNGFNYCPFCGRVMKQKREVQS